MPRKLNVGRRNIYSFLSFHYKTDLSAIYNFTSVTTQTEIFCASYLSRAELLCKKALAKMFLRPGILFIYLFIYNLGALLFSHFGERNVAEELSGMKAAIGITSNHFCQNLGMQ